MKLYDKAMLIASQILSAVFSPLLVPTISTFIALWLSRLSFLSNGARLSVAVIVFALTCLVPMAVIIVMMKMGKVSDSSISDRKERGIPYTITGLCYIATAIVMSAKHAPHWFVYFFCGAAVAVAFAFFINFSWKISAHGTTMGGLVAFTVYLSSNGLAVQPMLPWIIATVIATGAVGTARLYLKRHTPAQVYAGIAMGFLIEYIAMSI